MTHWLTRYGAVTGMLLAGLGAFSSSASGAARTFTERFATNTSGDIAQIGNTLMTCPVSNPKCPSAQDGTATGGELNNNDYVMQYINEDVGGGRFSSSSADLTLPAGATVLKAMLYFGGDSTAGTGGAPPPDVAARDTVQFRAPGQLVYTPLTASNLDNVTGAGDDYQGVVDVTSQVVVAGSGTYWVGDVQSGTGEDRDAGWALVVAYQHTSEPPRNLSIFDGFQVVNTGHKNVSIPVSGFETPVSGPVRTRLGFIAYEGDAGSVGDAAELNTTTLTDAQHPANNFFDSRIAIDGVPFTAKDPNYLNQLGFDASQVRADGVLGNGDKNAVVRVTTGGETYYPGVVTFATELFAPEVQLQKSVQDLNGGQVQPGDTLRYTVTATNQGLDDAVRTVLTDPIPTNSTYVPGSLTVDGTGMNDDYPGTDQAGFDSANNRTVFWIGMGASGDVGGTLAASGGASTVTFDVSVNAVPPGFEIKNATHAEFFARTLGTPLAADSNSVSSTVASPDLTIAKTPTNFTLVAGNPQTFQLTVTNGGTAPTDGSQISVTDPFDAVPPGAFDEITAISGTGWTCTPASLPAATPETVSCQRTTPTALGAGDSYPPISVTAHADDSAPTSNIANTATVAGGGDADPTNNSSTNVGQVTARADVELLKTADPTTSHTGGKVTFTLRVRNAGPSDAQDVDVNDSTLAANYTVDQVTSSQGSCPSSDPVECDLGTMNPGDEATVTIVATVTAGGAGVVTADNTASATSTTTDPDTTNNSSTASVQVAPTADLRIAKSSAPDPLDSSGPTSYTLTVTNDGPQTATGAVVTDSLPDGFSFASATPDQGTCTHAPGDHTVRCDLGDIPNGTSVNVDVEGTLAASTAGTVLLNTAAVNALTADPNQSNNTTAHTSPVLPSADLQVTKFPHTQAASPGAEVAFKVDVTNLGPDPAADVQVSDLLPPGLSLISAPGCSASGGALTCPVGTLASGASQEFEVRARVEGSAAGTLANIAHVTSNTPDHVEANDVDTATVEVEGQGTPRAPGAADVSVTKRALGRAVAGQRLRYAITVRNRGPQAAAGVVVTDDLPAGLRFVSAKVHPGSCGGTRTVRCNLGTLEAEATRTVTLTVVPRAPGTVRNGVRVSSLTPDSDVGNNSATARNVVRAQPTRLGVRKRVSRPTVAAGGVLRYTLTLRVAGPGSARNLRVCDRPSHSLSLTSAPRARLRAGQACWTRKHVAAGKTIHFALTARVARSANGRVVNTAVAQASNAHASARGRVWVRVRPAQQRGGGVTG